MGGAPTYPIFGIFTKQNPFEWVWVSGLETIARNSLFIHVLILILCSKSVADRVELRRVINDFVLDFRRN